ncbi:MAG: 50S ribosomal protein L6 [Candidatus Magasanikbacteria bacterium CG10_big_fil_rev_8_21_14_0_10_36_32]|uniref:Large ribosomal subunit protein uL6 n=1 Tax=Candidatus Magasanikbacteria bacterium CG10_big_fil_rev_8_21_14_0_10_36_32 TaxID=1974646 RepID=A0A2M6W6M8_9BACT|nr:MAG: 50S ribosomal protein L6 [Candidatus Magasanikbacteria bacterium CG10_big_fil_rev_8_21_14_0_10_36_32]
MSRIGKKIRTIPQGVTVEISGNELIVRGPKGELRQVIHPRVTISINNGEIAVMVVNTEDKKDRSLWGTFSSLIENMLDGVTNGFQKQLEINGVGYKVSLKGEALNLELGFSHPILFKLPAGIKFAVEKNVVTVSGIDKQLVGETAAQIRNLRKPEPYKGKGIKYVDEVIRRKAGKTATKSSK